MDHVLDRLVRRFDAAHTLASMRFWAERFEKTAFARTDAELNRSRFDRASTMARLQAFRQRIDACRPSDTADVADTPDADLPDHDDAPDVDPDDAPDDDRDASDDRGSESPGPDAAAIEAAFDAYRRTGTWAARERLLDGTAPLVHHYVDRLLGNLPIAVNPFEVTDAINRRLLDAVAHCPRGHDGWRHFWVIPTIKAAILDAFRDEGHLPPVPSRIDSLPRGPDCPASHRRVLREMDRSDQLTPVERLIFVLYFVEKLSPVEIGVTVDLAEDHVRQICAKTMALCRQKLKRERG